MRSATGAGLNPRLDACIPNVPPVLMIATLIAWSPVSSTVRESIAFNLLRVQGVHHSLN
jgi:hypothetical protein